MLSTRLPHTPSHTHTRACTQTHTHKCLVLLVLLSGAPMFSANELENVLHRRAVADGEQCVFVYAVG